MVALPLAVVVNTAVAHHHLLGMGAPGHQCPTAEESLMTMDIVDVATPDRLSVVDITVPDLLTILAAAVAVAAIVVVPPRLTTETADVDGLLVLTGKKYLWVHVFCYYRPSLLL